MEIYCDLGEKENVKGFKKFVIDNPNPYIVDDKYMPYLIQCHDETGENQVQL